MMAVYEQGRDYIVLFVVSSVHSMLCRVELEHT
jgi:hypothetical protein